MKTKSNLFPTWTIYGLALAVLGLSLAPVTSAASNFTDANWSSMGGFPGANGEVRAVVIDVSGNLYIGGDFTVVGDVIANGLAKWDGINWSPLRTGTDTYVNALAVIGSELYAAGYIKATDGIAANIAKWDGSNWSALGSGIGGPDPANTGGVSALTVSGSDLYAGGSFTRAGDIAATNIAKWNGSSWSALGSGLNDGVAALAVSGANLYAGGSFTRTGGIVARSIAKWDGNSWSALPTGLSGYASPVVALAVSGGNLYAARNLNTVGGTTANSITKWDGSSWSALGAGFAPTGGFSAVVSTLAVSGNDLYVGGSFRRPKQDVFVAKWNGANWSALGSLGTGRSGSDYVYCRMRALAVSGTNLYAGGVFGAADGDNIATWDGNSWSALGSGSGLNSEVSSLAVSGSDLYVAGGFTAAGGVAANYIAKWNGSAWSALGLEMNYYLSALAVSGSDLYAVGYFTTAGGITTNGIAKRDGSNWSVLGSGIGTSDPGVPGEIVALTVSGSDLFAGGTFTTFGGIAATNVAKWNGSSWTALGLGINGYVAALAVSGGDVYAGGGFTAAGGVAANSIAKWNGSSWTALGLGINGYVAALAVSGSDVYAGGAFTNAGGIAATNVAKWNGSSWSALGSGIDYSDNSGPTVYALAVSGSDLYAGGVFTTAGGRQANHIAKWNGSSWSALGSGLSGYRSYDPTFTYMTAMAVSGNDLYAGGSFTQAGGKVSPFIARAYLLDLPPLSVLRSGSDVTVSWPSANTADFTLEQSTALSGPSSWAANTAIVTDAGVNRSVTLSATNSPQFFRLRR